MGDDYVSCIENLDLFPEMDKLDCDLSLEQDALFCSCEEPISPADQVVCGNGCLRDLKNCDLIAINKEVRCRIKQKTSLQNCLDARAQDNKWCVDAYNTCVNPPPVPPNLVATVDDTMSYRPPS